LSVNCINYGHGARHIARPVINDVADSALSPDRFEEASMMTHSQSEVCWGSGLPISDRYYSTIPDSSSPIWRSLYVPLL